MRILFSSLLAVVLATACIKKQNSNARNNSRIECMNSLPVQAYLTYIPPEGDLLGREVVKRHGCCATLVIQNGHDSSQIFKRPVEFYGQPSGIYYVDARNIAAASENQDAVRNVDSKQFIQKLQSAISEQGQKLLPADKTLDSATLQNPNLKFTVFVFNAGRGGSPAFVMESVEMGRTPNYMHGNTIVLNAINSLATSKGVTLELTSFGTGGGIDRNNKVGDVVELKGSLFVGFTHESAAGSRGYIPLIRVLDTQSDREIGISKKNQLFLHRKDAESEVKKQFLNLNTALNRANEESTSAPVLADVRGRNSYSLTVTEIGTEDVKQKAQEFRLANVNMEDFHVIRTWHTLKPQQGGTLRLLRIISDTHGVGDDLAQRAMSWARQSSYSLKEYADLIAWALDGSPIGEEGEIPEAAFWKAFEQKDKANVREFLVPLESNRQSPFLDPFAKEFAEAAFADIEQQRFFSLETLSEKTLTDLRIRNLNADELINFHHLTLKKNLQDLLQTKKNPSALMEKAMRLAENMAYMKTPSGEFFPLLATTDKASGIDLQARMHIWARLGKWNQNKSVTLQSVIDKFPNLQQFKSSPVFDRMFYRSNMSTAMPAGIQKVVKTLRTCN